MIHLSPEQVGQIIFTIVGVLGTALAGYYRVQLVRAQKELEDSTNKGSLDQAKATEIVSEAKASESQSLAVSDLMREMMKELAAARIASGEEREKYLQVIERNSQALEGIRDVIKRETERRSADEKLFLEKIEGVASSLMQASGDQLSAGQNLLDEVRKANLNAKEIALALGEFLVKFRNIGDDLSNKLEKVLLKRLEELGNVDPGYS